MADGDRVTQDRTPVRVLVLWADGASANLGVRALAEGCAALARKAWGVDTVVDFQDFKGRQSDVAFDKRALVEDALLPRGPIVRKLRQYDVILDSGAGDSFTDIYGLKRMLAIMYTQRVAARSGLTLVLAPQTVGPFETKVGRAAARRVLRGADVVLPRDPVSAACLHDLGHSVVATATDVVFALPQPAAPAAARDVLVNVSGLLWSPNPHVDHHRYRDSVLELCRQLQESGREVTLLAHVLANGSDDDDVPAVRGAATQLAGPVEVLVPEDLPSLRTAVSGARVVIGSRMHACLNALSVGTPAIPWSYSRKFAPLLTDLGWSAGVELRTEPEPVLRTLEQLDVLGGPSTAATVQALGTTARARLDAAARLLHSLVVVPSRG